MADLITVMAGVSAAVTLFDKIPDQVERFIRKRPAPPALPRHRMTILEADGDLVVIEHGTETQRITGDDLAKLPKPILDHVTVLEESMQNHYTVWSAIYPQLAVVDPVQKAKLEAQLNEVIKSMKSDLDGTCVTIAPRLSFSP